MASFFLCIRCVLIPTEDSTLVITEAEVGDSGQYKCHVQNAYGIADSTTVITVKGKPSHRHPSALRMSFPPCAFTSF